MRSRARQNSLFAIGCFFGIAAPAGRIILTDIP